jgi:hypothetical protein
MAAFFGRGMLRCICFLRIVYIQLILAVFAAEKEKPFRKRTF